VNADSPSIEMPAPPPLAAHGCGVTVAGDRSRINALPAKPRLLVVDDDAMLRGMAVRTLRHTGFDVIEVDSGERALERFATEQVDLVLLDALMGGIDGFETCRRLRAMPRGQRLPVLMLTGLNDTESIEAAYEAGATDFITKPIQWVLLAHRVRYGLRAAAAAEAMRRSRESLARAQRMVHMGNWELTTDGRMNCSEELARIFGMAADAVQAAPSEALLACVRESDRERVRVARELLSREGVAYQMVYAIDVATGGASSTVFEQASPVRDEQGRVVMIEGITQDISERVEAERQIRHLALHDTVTGLPNRDFFIKLAAPALEQASRSGATCAVLHIDLDRFKSINDAFGHDAGDDVLRAVSKRLSASTRGSDLASVVQTDANAGLVARISGNAFTIMLAGIGRPEHASTTASRLLHAISQPIVVRGQELLLSACVGIALFPRDGRDAEALIRYAEQAQYEAKKAGRGQHRFFNEAMNAVASARVAHEADLRHAIGNDELRVYLQPKVDAASRAVVGAEALVRWQHPQRGLVPPMEFIPLAEETGLIMPLTDWVLDAVCRRVAAWTREGLLPVSVAVNVASPYFEAEGLVERLVGMTRRHGLQPRQLVLEVTESMLMHDVDRAVARLNALRERGFKLSLDDFGTGYSSLAYLKRFPIDELKIDRSFVNDVQHDGKDGALVASIITLARMLELQVVAEGVETEAQAAVLRALGCTLHQGYLYARPRPAESFADLLDRA